VEPYTSWFQILDLLPTLVSPQTSDLAVPRLTSHGCKVLLWVQLCPPHIYILKPQIPGPQNVTLFGNRVVADVMKVDVGASWSRVSS